MAKCFCGSGKKQEHCHHKINEKSILADIVRLYSNIDLYEFPQCPSGCVDCCFDYFFITEKEFYLIAWYLTQKKTQEYIENVVKRSRECKENLKELYPQKYEELETVFVGSMNPTDISKYFSDRVGKKTISLTKPCPFLSSNNRCDIYPVRPFICRAYGSVVPPEMKSIMAYSRCKKKGHYSILDSALSEQISSLDVLGNQIRRPYPIFEWMGELFTQLPIRIRGKDAYELPAEDFYQKYKLK